MISEKKDLLEGSSGSSNTERRKEGKGMKECQREGRPKKKKKKMTN